MTKSKVQTATEATILANAERSQKFFDSYDELHYALKRASAMISQHHDDRLCCKKDMKIIQEALKKASNLND